MITTPSTGRAWIIRTRAKAAGAVSLLVLFASGFAQAQSPYEVRQRALERQVLRTPRTPEALLPLVELWQQWENVPQENAIKRLRSISRSARLSEQNRAIAKLLYSDALLRSGDVTSSREEEEAIGFLQSFWVVGPFDNDGKRGFDEPMPPESSLTEGFDPSAAWVGKGRVRRWRELPQGSSHGYVNLADSFWPQQEVCAYAASVIEMDASGTVILWMGAAGAVRVWWNGTEAFEDTHYRGAWPDRSAVALDVKKGDNELLIKSCVAAGSWGFYARLTDTRARPLRKSSAGRAYHPTAAGRSRPPEAALDWFRKRAEASKASPAHLEDYARFLQYTNSDDPAEELAKHFARQAASKKPSVRALLLAAKLETQRAEAARHIEQARGLAPKAPEVLLARADLALSGFEPDRALPILDKLSTRTLHGLEGVLLRAELLQDLELDVTALELLRSAQKKVGESPRWLRVLATAASTAGQPDLAIQYRRRALAARYDDLSSRRVLLRDAMQRGELEYVDQQLAVFHDLASNTGELRHLSAVYESLGRSDEALEMLGRALLISPEDPGLLVAHGRLLLRLGQDDAAVEVLGKALAFRPQDADTRDLIDHVELRTRDKEDYSLAADELLKLKVSSSTYSSTLLQDLTVTRVHDNGLGSTFRQIAAQVHTDQGAREWRQFSIQFDPNTQRVDLLTARVHRKTGAVLEATSRFEQDVGEPWYRIYYDTRALTIVFPELESDDVVELQWRLDDVAHRNLFADYFGHLQSLQGASPTVHFEYILLTPKSREFFFNKPELKGLQHTTHIEGPQRIDRFSANDIPAISIEQGMPGITEIAPYLHISTYRTWEEVGRWYWGLIRDQLRADESLKAIVNKLIKGARTEHEKVKRIHAWVLANTRYVGLEFGIHGYKPYRVTEIVQRGFGDCKDKASLLHAMFREAGIDSDIVLVRTRDNGRIADLPASLAVFDHAISYVPSLEIYLDGTAEHSGMTELPAGDQGVTVLHVNKDGAELRRTPVARPEENRWDRQIEIALADDGSAQLTATEEIRGVEASRYRSTFEAVGSREERFEGSMQLIFPGFRLVSLHFESLSDLNRPVRLRYQAAVPQAAVRNGRQLQVAPSVLDGLYARMAGKPRRVHALDLGTRRLYEERRTVRLPQGSRVVAMPQGGTVESPFGRLTVRVSAAGRTVEAVTELALKKDRIEPDEYPAFRQWAESADQLLRERITIEGAE